MSGCRGKARQTINRKTVIGAIHRWTARIRWSCRIWNNSCWERKASLADAARASKKTLSEFILEKSLIEAEIALSQRTRFVLDSERWSKFIDLLERPVTTKPALKKLLREPSVLER
jgi:uncharacterized protein (DUF1778 family)